MNLDEPIQRQFAFNIAWNIIASNKYPRRDIGEVSFFDDTDILSYNKDGSFQLVKNGIVNGYPDGTLNPAGIITRAETSTVISKCIAFEQEIDEFWNNSVFGMMNKLVNDTTLNISSTTRQSMVTMGIVLLDYGYEPAFVAGILGNISEEGKIGKFENSYYKTNPSAKPDYLKSMETHYQYDTEYSGKYVYNDISVKTLYEMLDELEDSNWREPDDRSKRIGFGLGCIQWTFSRTKTLVEVYKNVAGESDTITVEQTAYAEGLMIIGELEGKYTNGEYKNIYPNWKSKNVNTIESETAAYNAGEDICTMYEQPSGYTQKAPIRGGIAKNVYKILTNK